MSGKGGWGQGGRGDIIMLGMERMRGGGTVIFVGEFSSTIYRRNVLGLSPVTIRNNMLFKSTN